MPKHVKNAIKVFVVSFVVIATGGALTKGALLGIKKFCRKISIQFCKEII